MTHIPEDNAEEILFKSLKEILLKDERAKMAAVIDKMAVVEERMQDPEEVKKQVLPILEEQLEIFKKSFPKEYELFVTKLITEQIRNSQDEIVDAIYPSLGKMIKKYINQQIQLIKDSVDERLKTTFTMKGLLWKVKSSIFGIKDSDAVFSEYSDYEIEEVYLIQKDSGLLLGSASREATMDKDVLAGMLTAIKAFVEDAFKREQEDLESIQYMTYKVVLQSFPSYYIALAISGTLSSAEEDELGNRIFDFADKYSSNLGAQPNEQSLQHLSDALQKEFLAVRAKK